jgi:MerR family transcriptional regulator, light-induced transcriptional regulator
MDSLHSMGVVTRRTGLKPDLIRVWERRYGAVTPTRSQARQRLYSESEILRLQMLPDATRAGYGIGRIAHLSEEKLRTLSHPDLMHGRRAAKAVARAKAVGRDPLEAGLAAIRRLDARALEDALDEAASELGQCALLEQVIVPLLRTVGALWQRGSLRVASEHMATAVIRGCLADLARTCSLPANAPRLLVATPSGHVHELGAQLVAVAAGQQGWRVIYVGPSLPAEEIAGAARLQGVRAVAVSLVYPEDDPLLEAELRRLRRLLPQEVPLLVGGRAAPAYQGLLREIAAIQLRDLAALRSQLDVLRGSSPASR